MALNQLPAYILRTPSQAEVTPAISSLRSHVKGKAGSEDGSRPPFSFTDESGQSTPISYDDIYQCMEESEDAKEMIEETLNDECMWQAFCQVPAVLKRLKSMMEGSDTIIIIKEGPVEPAEPHEAQDIVASEEIGPSPHTEITEARGFQGLDVIKSIVYGGLIESITSLGIVSSAAGADAATCGVNRANMSINNSLDNLPSNYDGLNGEKTVLGRNMSIDSSHDNLPANSEKPKLWWERILSTLSGMGEAIWKFMKRMFGGIHSGIKGTIEVMKDSGHPTIEVMKDSGHQFKFLFVSFFTSIVAMFGVLLDRLAKQAMMI